MPATSLYNSPHHFSHILTPLPLSSTSPSHSQSILCNINLNHSYYKFFKSKISISTSSLSLSLSLAMDKLLKLPPGFRFHPTDEELVVQYLRRKVFSYPLPASVIPEINLGKYDPWDLLGGCNKEGYFFNVREAKYAVGSRANRATGSGYWKATGKDKAVVGSNCNRVVGMKKVLVFYRGKAPGGERTDWVMHEYRLHNSTHCAVIPSRDWVLCRIFKKKRATKTDVEEAEENRAVGFIDFMNRCDTESSCVTDSSDGPGSGEDVSSSV